MEAGTQAALLRLVNELLPATIHQFIAKLKTPGVSIDSIQLWVLDLPQKPQREALSAFLRAWQLDASTPSPNELVGALGAFQYVREQQTKAEICWSGPVEALQGFRSTSAALNELLNHAAKSILILTYSATEVEHLRSSLEEAIARGISVQLVYEHFDVFQQKALETRLQAFGASVLAKVEVYIWPTEKRRAINGRIFGSMHVKCAVVDEEVMLVTSANWSAAAMQDNMELGAVIRDIELIRSVSEHFDGLILRQELVRHP